MKNVIIDCEKLMQKEQVHLYLAELFDFPDYYGKNLDALFDCLTELGECVITLKGKEILEQTNSYGSRILKVMEEATGANSNLRIKVSDIEL